MKSTSTSYGHFCLLTVTFFAFISKCTGFKDAINQASSHVVEVGRSISIECVQASHAVGKTPNDTEPVVWRRKPTIFDKYWIDIGNARGKNADYSSNNLVLSNVSLDYSGIYGCFRRNSSNPLKTTHIQIGYPPQPPFGISCETNGHLTLMTCCWQDGRETFLNTTYRMECQTERMQGHQIPLQPDSQKHWPCELSGSTLQRLICCSVALTPKTKTDLNSSAVLPTYTVQVNASNALGHAHSLPSIEAPQIWVTPNPPRNVKIAKNGHSTGHRSTSLHVRWTAPDVNHLIRLIYKLRYRISTHGDTWHTVEGITETTYVVTNLRSGSNYQVQVAARENSDMFNGFWSDWSDVASQRTDHNVPTSKFYFENVHMTVANTIQSGNLNMIWRPYARTDEPGFHYKLRISYDTANTTRKLTYATTIVVELKSNTTLKEVHVSGQYCNVIGCSVSDDRVLHLNQEWRPVTDVDFQLDNSHLRLFWQRPERPCGDGHCIIQICRSARAGIAFDEIFGNTTINNAKGVALRECEDIDDKASCDSGSWSVYGYSISPCNEYTAKVLQRCSSTRNGDIFIESTPSNLITYNPAFETVSFDLKQVNGGKGFNIFWDQDVACSGIDGYTTLSAIYVPAAGAECNFTQCFGVPSHERILNCSTLQKWISDEVYGETVYRTGLGYCCDDSLTSTSHLPFCFAASVVKHVTTTVKAPEAPRRLSWSSNSKITINWVSPRHTNGKLDGYTIAYGKNSAKFAIHETKSNSYELPLSCDSSNDDVYWVRVSAYNIGSNGIQLHGPTANASGIVCLAGASKMSDLAGIFVGLAISFTVICIGLVLCHYHRKRIKDAVRKGIWPPVPNPMLMVSFNVNNESQSVQRADIITPLNPLSADNELEKVDDITETLYRCDNTNASNQSLDTAWESNVNVQPNLEHMCLLDDTSSQIAGPSTSQPTVPADSGLSSLRGNRRWRAARSRPVEKFQPSDGSNLTEYSTLSPAQPSLSISSVGSLPDTYASTSIACASRPTSWSSLTTGTSVSRSRHIPSQRCCSENSLSYVRYCRENGSEIHHMSPLHLTRLENNGDPPNILYTKLATVDTETLSCSDLMQDTGAPERASQQNCQNKTESGDGSSQSLCDYVGQIDPYVISPAHNERFDGDLENCAESPCSSRRCSSSSASQDSIDRLYVATRQADNRMPDGEENNTGRQRINEYVTMDQALEMSEECSTLAGASNLAEAGDMDGLPELEVDATPARSEYSNSSSSTSAQSEMGYISVAEATQIGASTSPFASPQHR